MRTEVNSGLIYHQKFTLVDNIIRRVEQVGAKSLLDIGAGSTEVALPLSRAVDTYLAVEQEPARAAKLREANLNVVAGRFPVPINQTFDMVLSSHSIPERSLSSYPSFLSEAWKLTNHGGQLLIVTFKGKHGDLARLEFELLGRYPRRSAEYDAVITYLEKQGRTRIERVNSYIQARSGEVLANFLGPWISGDRQVLAGMMPALIHVMNTRYKVQHNYFVFPTEHLFISCDKD